MELKGNPFKDENISFRGGALDNKTMIVTGIRVETKVFHNDDRPDSEVGYLYLDGLIEGYGWTNSIHLSAGGQQRPSEDGLGFVGLNGEPTPFHVSCNLIKFLRKISKQGFDVDRLWDETERRHRFDRFVGARFHIIGDARKDAKTGEYVYKADGETPKIEYKYDFLGYGTVADAEKSASEQPDGLRDKAIDAVLTALTEAGGSMGRADLVRAINKQLGSDPDKTKIAALLLKDSFHKDVPWTKDGSNLSL